MKVYIKGRGKEVDLTQRDLVGQGGEGVVYAQRNTAYKVYHDPQHMIPEGKIQELSVLLDDHVIRPREVLVDKRGKPVGYTTLFIPNAWTLCQLFPPSFRKREGVTSEKMEELVRKLQQRVSNIHSVGILVVDLNEMNFLVDKRFEEVYCIDVDSYETPHYPAPAIMDSIRDWTTKRWSPLSDWFSFGVLAFQMFVGVHPFKGRYHGRKAEFRSKLPTDADDDTFAITRRRMQHNISVFHRDVNVPGVALPFDTIPEVYRVWFEKMFANGERSLPPSSFAPVVFLPVPVATVSGTALLEISEVGSYDGTVIGVWHIGTTRIVATDKGMWQDSTMVPCPSAGHCGFTNKNGRAVVLYTDAASRLSMLYNMTDRQPLGPLLLEVKEFSSYDGRLYVRTADSVHEIVLTDLGSQVVATVQEVDQVVPHATRLYSGVVIQNLLGATFVSLLFRLGASLQVAVKELNSYRIVDAKYERGVMMVVGERKGRYDRFVFRFDDDGQYDVRVVKGVTPSGLNFVTLDSGVCVCLNEEEKLEVFSAKRGATSIKYVEDATLSGDMRLYSFGGTVLFSKGNRVYSMKMK